MIFRPTTIAFIWFWSRTSYLTTSGQKVRLTDVHGNVVRDILSLEIFVGPKTNKKPRPKVRLFPTHFVLSDKLPVASPIRTCWIRKDWSLQDYSFCFLAFLLKINLAKMKVQKTKAFTLVFLHLLLEAGLEPARLCPLDFKSQLLLVPILGATCGLDNQFVLWVIYNFQKS